VRKARPSSNDAAKQENGGPLHPERDRLTDATRRSGYRFLVGFLSGGRCIADLRLGIGVPPFSPSGHGQVDCWQQ
jgi:hypothetical protein